jgi:putative acyl-CoA dehydrogenase
MDSTHEVFNQPEPLADCNLFEGHAALKDALRFNTPGLDTAELSRFGALVGSAPMQEHARLANVHRPQLHTHDRFGRRIDQVEFHPSYHVLMGLGVEAGLHHTAAHTQRAAAFILLTQLEPSVLCPLSMTYAATPALRGNAAIHRDWSAGLASRQYDPAFRPWHAKSGLTMGMGMTEKQGGSDLRANTTRAVPDGQDAWGERYRLTGHKWFFSAPMSDAFLVLAQAPGGLTCFFLPRVLPDGATNAIRIQRLKDKLGNHANASAEVEFHGALAWRVGEEGRGVPQILEMGMLTRVDCALGTAGLMRQALALALDHAHQRQAFGKALVAQPLMRNVLADLALEAEAACALALRLARCLDHPDDPQQALLARVLTPVAKFWVCKRGSALAQEAMECLGGNGYVEAGGEGVMARIYREMPLNSIWEGAGNIMALDLLRALRKGDTAAALARELAPAHGADAALDRLIGALPQAIRSLTDESQARRLAQQVALAVQAALLWQSTTVAVAEAFTRSRIGGDWGHVFGTLPPGTDFDALLARAIPR